MFKSDKVFSPTRETYRAYFKELESKGFISDRYDENTSIEELKNSGKFFQTYYRK